MRTLASDDNATRAAPWALMTAQVDWLESKRRTTALLRGLMIVAVGALFVEAGPGRAGLAALALLAMFAVSDLILPFVPLRHVGTQRFDVVLGCADVVLVGLGVHLAVTEYALPICCLLMVLVMALGSQRIRAVAGAVAVGALHAWLTMQAFPTANVSWQLMLHTLFLCSVGMYYGYLTDGIHRLRRIEVAEQFERHDLEVLLEILATITSSLNPRAVTRAIVQGVAKLVPTLRCSILLVDDSLTDCTVLASHDAPDLSPLELDLKRYPEIVHAVKARSPLVIPDVRKDPLMAAVREKLAGSSFSSLMIVPMVFGDECLGVLSLKSAQERKAFSRREVDLCLAVARAAANALKNSTLHRQVLDESNRHRTTARKLSRILDQSAEIILTTDTEGQLTEINRAGERLLGFDKDEVLHRPCATLLESEDADLVERLLSAGVITNHACRLRRSDSSQLETELNLSVLRDDDGRVAGTIWAGRDVSELNAAQRQLIQAEKLSGIGSAIAGVAHELNNPLSVVLGLSELLREHHANSPLGADLAKIDESGRRCQRIVSNLLSFARVHTPERKYQDLNGIVAKALELKEYSLRVSNVRVVQDLDPRLPFTMLDAHQLQQVLVNMLSNAEQAMAAVPDRAGELIVRTSQEHDRLRVEIRDNGAGMDADTLRQVFNPFFSTKETGQGTGLGLSICYGIVQEHGGHIHVSSRPGEGASLVVELPICGEQEAADPAVQDESNEARGDQTARTDARVLVVDDEPMILEVVRRVLEWRGLVVDTAKSGAVAMRSIAVDDYDMVLSDMRMPGMSGQELYLRIAEERPELAERFLFMTGDLMGDETLQFLEQHGLEAIPKPVSMAKLLTAVAATLRQAQPQVTG